MQDYKSVFLNFLEQEIKIKEPKNLYKPIKYILDLGGKRIRPILTLMSLHIFNSNYKNGLHAALAIEVFHNFTLIHDDIMDAAPLRRGKITVHQKWDINTGILSGDAMMILAYQYLDQYEGTTYKRLMQVFNQTALEVCEGQQMDIDFETRDDVKIAEYLQMITLKTSVLIGCALKFGAIIASVDEIEAQKIYDFGLNLGIAFQIQDDYLDAFGNPEIFGKQVGGDIIENKKTYLYLTALNNGSKNEVDELIDLYFNNNINEKNKVEKVKSIFEKSGAVKITKEKIEKYTKKALSVLESLSIDEYKKNELKNFGIELMNRKV